MNHPYIDDEHVIDRYLAGELSDDDVERFEEHLFACEACLEAVEWGDELRRGVRTVAANGVDFDPRREPPEVLRAASKPWLASPTGRGVFAVLALSLLALGVVALRQTAELQRLRQAPPDVASGFTEPTGDFQVASLGVVRDGGVTDLRLDPRKEAVLLSLELPQVSAAGYRVTLFDRADHVVWRGDDLEPSLYDSLMVAVPASFLPPGTYRAVIEGQPLSAASTVGTIEFRVVLDGL